MDYHKDQLSYQLSKQGLWGFLLYGMCCGHHLWRIERCRFGRSHRCGQGIWYMHLCFTLPHLPMLPLLWLRIASGLNVVLIACFAGTERCSEALQKLWKKFYIVVNIQGDEPLMEPEIVDGVVKALQVFLCRRLDICPSTLKHTLERTHPT